MKKSKFILTAIVLIALLFINGMVAYFTDIDISNNTFIIGKVNINLSETDWNEANGKNLLPSKTIPKNPVITNETNSNDAYIFAKVIVPYKDQQLFTYTLNNGWELVEKPYIDTKLNTITYIYSYSVNSTMTKLYAGNSTPAIFNTVTFANITDPSIVNGVNLDIIVEAYGIQSNNLSIDTPADIFKLF